MTADPSELRPAPAPASHVSVADALRRRIALGGFVPGERLPVERELAEMLGVGRATLRRALRLLADEGLVVTTIGRSGGTFVREAPQLPETGRRRVAKEVWGRLDQSYEFRLAVEPVAARLCAERATARQRRAIERLLAEETPSIETYHSLDSRFHLLVAEGSRNAVLLDAIERARTDFFVNAGALWVNVDWGRQRAVRGELGDVFRQDHSAIGQAIGRRDGEAAAAAMTVHLRAAADQFRALMRTIRGR